MPNKKTPYTLPEWAKPLRDPLSKITDEQIAAWGKQIPPVDEKNQELYRSLSDKHRQLMTLAKELLSPDQCTRLARNAKVSTPPNLTAMFAEFRQRVKRARRIVADNAARREQEELEARRMKKREYERQYRARVKAEADAMLDQRLESIGTQEEE